jgi:hypothetical protein
MSVVTVNAAGGEAIHRAEVLLQNIPNGVNRAMKTAMGKTVTVVRRESTDAIQKQYDISAANLRAAENITASYRYGEGVEAVVVFHGKKIPLYRYNGTSPGLPTKDMKEGRKPVMVKGHWTRQYQGVAARGHQFKSTSPKEFYEAFIARMESGHVGIFERTGGVTSEGSDQIHELMGTAVPQMIGNETVLKSITETAYQSFESNLDAAVAQVLSGK